MSGRHDFTFEPIPGLPALPPKGEIILWQGRPDTAALAMQAFKIHWVGGYFVLLMAWRGTVGAGLDGLRGALAYGLPYIGFGLLACGIVWLLALAQARATVYTITSARVAMRIGAALSVTLNLPFAQLASAGLAPGPNGTGTIALRMAGATRFSYLVLWPNARPWALDPTEPALRCIPDAARVAQILADAAETRLSQPVVSHAAAAAPLAPAE